MGIPGRAALRRKIGKFERRLKQLRTGTPNRGQLVRFAQSLGRKERTGAQAGSGEPSYVNRRFPELRPIQIPHPHSKGLKRRTANSILDDLEDMDLAAWRALLGMGGSADGEA